MEQSNRKPVEYYELRRLRENPANKDEVFVSIPKIFLQNTGMKKGDLIRMIVREGYSKEIIISKMNP